MIEGQYEGLGTTRADADDLPKTVVSDTTLFSESFDVLPSQNLSADDLEAFGERRNRRL